MFTQNGQWKDPQGLIHTDAVFRIAQSNITVNEQAILDASEGYADADVASTVNVSLQYQILYWPNQEALDANLPPYPLLNPEALANMDDPMHAGMSQEEKIWFRPHNLPEVYASLTAEAAAEKHCLETVIADGIVVE